MKIYKLKVEVVERYIKELYLEIEAESLEEAKELVFNYDLSENVVTEKDIESEITDVQLLGEWEDGRT